MRFVLSAPDPLPVMGRVMPADSFSGEGMALFPTMPVANLQGPFLWVLALTFCWFP